MLKLMKLELKRNRIKGYFLAVQIITAAMLGFTYLFALMPQIDKSQRDLELLMSYGVFSRLLCVISLLCFSVLSAVMFNRFVVEEYTGKKAILLFSYPVDRSMILWAKVFTVFLFTVAAMTSSGLITFSIFFITEATFHFMKDTLTLNVLLQTFGFVLTYAVIAASFAAISLWVGYWKKSASATLVANIILVSLLGNLLVMGIPNAPVAMGVAAFSIIISFIFVRNLHSKIMKLEV